MLVQMNNNFVYCNPPCIMWLTTGHKKSCFVWAKKHVRFTDLEWQKTIFSNEKNFVWINQTTFCFNHMTCKTICVYLAKWEVVLLRCGLLSIATIDLLSLLDV